LVDTLWPKGGQRIRAASGVAQNEVDGPDDVVTDRVGGRDEFPLGLVAGQLAHFEEALETPDPDLTKHIMLGFVRVVSLRKLA
jgi:hypothetical protein